MLMKLVVVVLVTLFLTFLAFETSQRGNYFKYVDTKIN